MGNVGFNLVQVNNATAIDRPAALDAQGRVKLGKNPPISLKDISAYWIPFLGFKHATRVSNEKAGIQSSLHRAAEALTHGNAASFDPKALLKSLETLRQYTLKLNSTQGGAVNTQGGAVDIEKTVMDEMKALVEGLSNGEVLALYDQLLTLDMEDLKQAMAFQARTSVSSRAKMVFALDALATLEAVVVSDVSHRIADENQNTIALETGMNLAATGEKKAEGAEETRSGERRLMKQVGDKPISAREVADKMRSAELVMNVPTNVLFGALFNDAGCPTFNEDGDVVDPEDGLPLADPNFAFKNSVELAEDRFKKQEEDGEQEVDPNTRGKGGNFKYNNLRTKIEDSCFPEIAMQNGTGKDRPIYAALNLSGSLVGNESYGNVIVVFKDHVKKSATYTYGDTFQRAMVLPDAKARDRFLVALGENSDLSDETRAALKNPNSEVRRKIDALFDGEPRSFGTTIQQAEWVALISLMSAKRDSIFIGSNGLDHLLQEAFLEAALDKEWQKSDPVTFGNLEALLPKMSVPEQVRLEAYAGGLLNRPRMLGAQYIEAQLMNRPDFRRDVAEIRVAINEKDADGKPMTAEKLQKVENRLKAWSKKTGVKVVLLSPQAQVEDANDLSAANDNFNATDNEQYGMKKLAEGLAEKAVDAALSDPKKLTALFRAEDSDGKIAALVGDDYLDPVTSSYVKVLSRQWKDEIMATLTQKYGNFQGEQNFTERAVQVELADTFKRAFAKTKKREILRIIDEELRFDEPAQKREFARWALACMIKDPKELRLVHEGLKKMNALVADVAAGRLADAAAIGKALLALCTEFNKLEQDIMAGAIYGPDDVGANRTRIGSLAADLLNIPTVSPETKKKLFAAFTSPQMNATFNLICRAYEEYAYGMKVSDGNDALMQDLTQAYRMSYVINGFRQRLAELLGEPVPPQKLREQGLAAKDVPSADRKVFREIFPVLGADLDKRVPPAPERPLPPPMRPPTDSALKSGKLADRRAFLLKALPGYHKNELVNPETHEDNFDRGGDYHGRTHATRVFIYANVLANILKKMGVQVDVDAVARLAAGHDIGRTQNGPDQEENKSADITRGLIGDNAGQDHLDDVTKAITFNDKAAPPSIEAFVLHYADTLDHARVGTFDMAKFPFLRECLVLPDGSTIKIDEKLRADLVREATLLIRLTHPLANVQYAVTDGEYDLPSGGMDMERYYDDSEKAKETIRNRSDNVSDEALVTQIENLVVGQNAIEPIPTKRMFPLLSEFYRD